ncbi:MAG: carboxypeptidase regulatory-like domain-containing protein, partial [Gammaproteobacteria bacterium]
TANAYGPIYGPDWGNDDFLRLDPTTHTATARRIPVLDPETPPGKPQSMPRPSPYWGEELYWYDPAITNHAAMDSKGRVWMSSRFRKPEDQPAFCENHPSAVLAPQPSSFRQIQYFDPATQTFHQVDICFDTHHVQFAEDDDETLYGNGVFGGGITWVNTRILDETGDAAAAQGWCMPYFDMNEDGRIEPGVDEYAFEHLRGNDPGMLAGMRIPPAVFYSVIAHPNDGSVWSAVPGPMPGRIVRIDPNTCAAEVYEPPFNNPAVNVNGYTPRGIDVDSNGVIWTALAGSGHLASFDRRKCAILTGPESRTGQHCPEGWTLYRSPGPHFRNTTDEISVDMHYYNFVDRFNTLGLGPNTPIANGTNSDSLLVLRPDGRWLVMRVPYPLGFFSRGMDGRIDDPDGGWKGRGMYADYGQNAVWHIEGGLGSRSNVVRFQLRPDPLAK